VVTDSEIALDLDWAHLERLLAVVAGHVREDGVPDLVVGILRGGMVPAVMLAHRLGVRSVRGIEVTRTTVEGPRGAKTPHPVITNSGSLGAVAGADVLLVDDVAGSGATSDAAAALLREAAGRVRRAVVVVNVVNWQAANARAPHEIHDYLGTTCAGWVRFPWEVR
jgi:hypoxanthine phosphoribosyltransferase